LDAHKLNSSNDTEAETTEELPEEAPKILEVPRDSNSTVHVIRKKRAPKKLVKNEFERINVPLIYDSS
jgi:hypothetical protein